jgi:hypothetical protein
MAEPGADLTISVLTFGPGDHPFYKFGHNAILVHDATARQDDVYNYGTFSYQSSTLIPDFLKGRLRYWLSVQPLDVTVAHYRSENRSIVAQELALTPAERHALADRLAHDALPENRYYRYDYYGDNCSTRVRDAIDAVLEGKLHAASNGPAAFSLRGHTERLTADDLPVYLGLDVAMGDVIDRPISQWEEMFLPSKLQESLRRVTLVRPEGSTPLVARESVMLAAERAPLREVPPYWLGPMIASGVTGGLFLALLGNAGATSRLARAAFGAVLCALGLTAGLLGVAFAFLWLATDHAVASHNENLLQLSPLALLLAVAAASLAMGKRRAARSVGVLTVLVAMCSLAGLTLKVHPAFDQHNGQFIALFLPLWAGAALGARLVARGLRRP